MEDQVMFLAMENEKDSGYGSALAAHQPSDHVTLAHSISPSPCFSSHFVEWRPPVREHSDQELLISGMRQKLEDLCKEDCYCKEQSNGFKDHPEIRNDVPFAKNPEFQLLQSVDLNDFENFMKAYGVDERKFELPTLTVAALEELRIASTPFWLPEVASSSDIQGHCGNLGDAVNAHVNEGYRFINDMQISTEAMELERKKVNDYIEAYIQELLRKLPKGRRLKEQTCKSSVVDELEEEYQAAVNNNVHVVCLFYRGDKMDCKVMNDIFSKLAEQHPEAFFMKIHTGKNPGLVAKLKLKISKMPTIVLIKRGKRVRKIEPEVGIVYSKYDEEERRFLIEGLCNNFWK